MKPTSERVSQPFFSVKGRILTVNGQATQIFEFANAATAAAETKRVGATATTSVAWIAPPHFYHSGRLIVLYVGDNGSTLKLLTAVLGPQFAGQLGLGQSHTRTDAFLSSSTTGLSNCAGGFFSSELERW